MISDIYKELYKNLTQNEINSVFQASILNQNMEIIQYLLESPEVITKPEVSCRGNFAFINACRRENIHLMNYLVDKHHIKLDVCELEEALRNAFENRSILGIDFLISNEKINKIAFKTGQEKEFIREIVRKGNIELFEKYILNIELKVIDYMLIWGSACESGNINMVKHILQHPKFKDNITNVRYENDDALIAVCGLNNSEIKFDDSNNLIKWLLTSSELDVHCDIHAQNDKALELAFKNYNLKLITYLLTSDDLTEKINIQDNHFPLLTNNFLMRPKDVQFLFEHPQLENKINLRYKNDQILKDCCVNGYIETIKFLLKKYQENENYKKHINDVIEMCLITALENDQKKTIEYLIIETPLMITKKIKEAFKYQIKWHPLMKSKELKNTLETKLQDTPIINKKKINKI